MTDHKSILRETIKTKLMTMDATWRLKASKVLAEHVLSSRIWKAARVVGLFAGREDEVETSHFFSSSKLFLYPKVVDGELVFYQVKALEELQTGAFDVLEPSRKRQIIPDLILVPGLAFDATGGRLGRGKGFYDRWQTRNSTVAMMGVCFDFQMVDAVPMEDHDGRMNWVVTEAGFYPKPK